MAQSAGDVRAHLSGLEIETEIYYPLPLHLHPCFPGGKQGDLPEAERVAAEVLAVPVHPDLAPAQLEWVARAIRDFY